MNYILEDDGTIRKCDDLREWALWYEQREKRVVAQAKAGEYRVSTVFLGLDHSFGDGPPVLFETMVFGGKWDNHMDRYCTKAEAEAGHRDVVSRLLAGLPPWKNSEEMEV